MAYRAKQAPNKRSDDELNVRENEPIAMPPRWPVEH